MLLYKKNKTLGVIEKSDNIRYLQRRLEEVAFVNLCEKQVQPERYVPYDKTQTYKHIRGYFMVSKPEKITIYCRTVFNGYLYSTQEVKKIISYFILNPDKTKFSEEFQKNRADYGTTNFSRDERSLEGNISIIDKFSTGWDIIHKTIKSVSSDNKEPVVDLKFEDYC